MARLMSFFLFLLLPAAAIVATTPEAKADSARVYEAYVEGMT